MPSMKRSGKRGARSCRLHLSAMMSLILFLLPCFMTPLATASSAHAYQALSTQQWPARESIGLDEPRQVSAAIEDEESATSQDSQRTLLEVDAVDRNGRARPDTCFALFDRNDDLRVQACDDDDGVSDGVTRLRVRDGLEEGTYTLRETFTPDGGMAAEDQELELGPGRFQVSAQGSGSPAVEEPTQPPTEIPPTEVPPTEIPPTEVPPTEIPPTEVPPTEIPPTATPPPAVPTATEMPPTAVPPTQVPAATQPAGENPPVEPTATPPIEVVETPIVEIPTVEPTPQALGSLVVIAEDADGRRLPGACYTLETPPGGLAFGPFCDDDGDGAVVVRDISPGPATVIETRPPTDRTPAAQPRQTVNVAPGEQAEIRFRNPPLTPVPTAEPAGSVDVRIIDPAGEPVPACVDMFNRFKDYVACDNDARDLDARPGQVRFDPVTPGDYTVVVFRVPDGLAEPASQQIAVSAGRGTTVAFALLPQTRTGSVAISIADMSAAPVEACVDLVSPSAEYLVCDQDVDDRDQRPGHVRLEPVTEGDYALEIFGLPASLAAPPAQTIQVRSGEVTEIEVNVASLPGALVIQVEDERGEPLGGSCFTVEGNETLADVCDQDGEGRVGVAELPAGNYTVRQSSAAQGYLPGPEQNVRVEAGRTVEIVVQNAPQPVPATPTPEALPPLTPESSPPPSPSPAPEPTENLPEETGDVTFVTLDDNGNPLPGQCYSLNNSAGTLGPFCDDDERDVEEQSGVLLVRGIPVGTYEAILEPPLASANTIARQQAGQRQSVTVSPGEQPTEVVFNVTELGSLLVQVRDPQRIALAGACFSLSSDDQNRQPLAFCDDDANDQSSATGRILVPGITAGRYTLVQTVATPGFQPEAEQTVLITAGTVREIVVTNRAEVTANLDVVTVDEQGTRLTGACFALSNGSSTARECDVDGGEAGVTRFTGVEPGERVLRQLQVPSGPFIAADDRAVLLEPGQTTTATVVNQLRPGTLQLRKTNEAGDLLAGSCFALRREDRAVYTVCDNDASDTNRSDGVIILTTIVPGDYTLRETRSPVGYLPSADQIITIRAGQRTQVTVVNAQGPAPERTGEVRIFKVDAGGRALPGSCFALLDGTGRVVASACDAADGADDGTVQIKDASVGRLTLRETRRPSADFAPAPDVTVAVVEHQRVDVRVQNQLRTGRILIRKINQVGAPLAAACFDLVEDGATAACTNRDGELLFSGLTPGVYRVVETEVPPGYDAVPPRDAVTVRPGSTTTLTVVDRPVPPPPESGSIQIRKFICPAGADGARVAFFDSSDPTRSGAARTAGCNPGVASFTLDGPTGQMRFRTSDQGRFQSTLLTGDYVLTEVASGATENVSISVNRMTTVVVLNFVAPAAGPATLNVVKYTCDPGFHGRIWVDFAEGCLASKNLTNNVVFRLTGPVSVRRITGDRGQGGTTQFSNLPAGEYRLREVVPEGTAAVFAFCGQDPASPAQRFAGARANLRLAAGQVVTCAWFNVPEAQDATTGAVTIEKFSCPVVAPQPGFDWHANCDPQPVPVRFTLSRVWPSRVVWVIERAQARLMERPFDQPIEATTDSDGIAQLTTVPPGVYRLQEAGDAWCRAESDSVDARGRIVVRAGERATVQIFNCTGITEVPNTGAGPLRPANQGYGWDWSGATPLPDSRDRRSQSRKVGTRFSGLRYAPVE